MDKNQQWKLMAILIYKFYFTSDAMHNILFCLPGYTWCKKIVFIMQKVALKLWQLTWNFFTTFRDFINGSYMFCLTILSMLTQQKMHKTSESSNVCATCVLWRHLIGCMMELNITVLSSLYQNWSERVKHRVETNKKTKPKDLGKKKKKGNSR